MSLEKEKRRESERLREQRKKNPAPVDRPLCLGIT